MSQKNNPKKNTKSAEGTKNSETADGKKPVDRTGIYAAIIGLIGTIIIAIVSIINTRTQVLLPVALTETALPTKTNLPVSASTAFVCGNGSTIPQAAFTPQPIIPEPTLVVVMVDETTTQVTLEVVLSSLNKSLEAGDRVIIIVGGEKNYDKATLADEKIQSIAPLIPTPLLPPPSTPTPALVETPLGAFARRMATQTAEVKFYLATQTAIQYSCSAYEWNLSYQNQYLQWEAESKSLVSASIAKLGELIQNYETSPSNGGVFESMTLISNLSRIECLHGDYRRCVFVPVTNMVDARMQQPPSDIQLEYLKGFDVVGTIADCPLYNQECQNRADYWDDYFSMNDIRSIQFVNLDNLGNLLEQTIGR